MKRLGRIVREKLRQPSPSKSQEYAQKAAKADVAQLVEQPIRNRQVSGSSPLVGSSLLIIYHPSFASYSLLRPQCFPGVVLRDLNQNRTEGRNVAGELRPIGA
jgi:hypothetical protein